VDWLKLLVLLVPVAIWILTNLAKNRDEPRKLRAPSPRDDEDAPRPIRRRAPSDVDRFLEEVRRRRESKKKPEEAPAQARTSRPVQPAPATVRPAPRKVPSPPPLPPQPLRQEPGRRFEQRREEVVVAEVVPETTPPSAGARAIPTLMKIPTVGSAPRRPSVRQTLALLKAPQSLATAVLLQEILGKPLCQRQGQFPIHRK
jgi:hypothetical protein